MEEEAIDITGIDHRKLLVALWRISGPARGMGILAERAFGRELTEDDAAKVLAQSAEGPLGVRLDYVHGRVIKVSLKGDQLFFARLFNRDAGAGACERAIAEAREASRK